jgi:hypothetical protein
MYSLRIVWPKHYTSKENKVVNAQNKMYEHTKSEVMNSMTLLEIVWSYHFWPTQFSMTVLNFGMTLQIQNQIGMKYKTISMVIL